MINSGDAPPLPQSQAASTKRRWLLYLATMMPLAALVGLLAWGIVRSDGNPGGLLTNSESGKVTVVLTETPPFSVQPLDGGPLLDNNSLQGKVVMLDFWSSWCVPCRTEAPALAKVYMDYADLPVEFVGVAIWDSTVDVLRHLDRFGVTYPNALDERGLMAVGFGVRGIPEKYFFDRRGKIVAKYIGPMTSEDIHAIIDGILSSP